MWIRCWLRQDQVINPPSRFHHRSNIQQVTTTRNVSPAQLRQRLSPGLQLQQHQQNLLPPPAPLHQVVLQLVAALVRHYRKATTGSALLLHLTFTNTCKPVLCTAPDLPYLGTIQLRANSRLCRGNLYSLYQHLARLRNYSMVSSARLGISTITA
jgi:hypothetical protein